MSLKPELDKNTNLLNEVKFQSSKKILHLLSVSLHSAEREAHSISSSSDKSPRSYYY